MSVYHVRIEGITPLLFNKPPEYEGDSNIKIANPTINQDKELRNKLYTQEGMVYTPAMHIRGALMNAAKDLKIKGRGKATYSKLFASMVAIEPEAIEHKAPELDVSIVRTVNPNTKGMNMTKRPRLKKWALDFTVDAEDEIPVDVIKEALDRAGKYVGIGDWRPATKGIHGKFMVSKFEKNRS
jgi:hypothetical protein